MNYQKNPLLESNPYYNGAKFLGAGVSGLATAAGVSLIKGNDPKKILLIKNKINAALDYKTFFSLCKRYDIDTEDLMYYHKKYHYSLDELKENVTDKLDKLYKSQLLAKRIGYGLTGIGGAGLAYTTPSVAKAIKYGLSH